MPVTRERRIDDDDEDEDRKLVDGDVAVLMMVMGLLMTMMMILMLMTMMIVWPMMSMMMTIAMTAMTMMLLLLVMTTVQVGTLDGLMVTFLDVDGVVVDQILPMTRFTIRCRAASS